MSCQQPSFLKIKGLSSLVHLRSQLSRCHLERKVNPRRLSARASHVSPARVVNYGNVRLMHLLHAVGGETENSSLTAVHVKSFSALKKKRSRKRIRISLLGAELSTGSYVSKTVTRPDVFLNVKSPIRVSRSPVLY